MLLSPSSNRVYAGNSPAITTAELTVLAEAGIGSALRAVEPVSVAGVPYLRVDLEGEDLTALGQLAAGYALLEEVAESGSGTTAPPASPLLRPVALPRTEVLSDDLLTIPKYQGKTNEQLTRVALNVTLAATAWAGEVGRRRFRVLDPLAGRGTTLSWALALGHDAYGVELRRKEVDAYAAFLTTWLRRSRLKHTIDRHPLRRHGTVVAHEVAAELSPTREAWKAGERQSLRLWAADTTQSADLLGRTQVDAIVTDAPYGVDHAAGTKPARGASRPVAPAQLLAAAVPAWVPALRPGGALGIAWNTHTLSREDLTAICGEVGLEVLDDAAHLGLAHHVDAGIHRDVLVARRP
ncbi:SAM-dependent methyltransferase [Serinibacter salmoneus]|uniref:RNA methylase family UPF0020 n=1 Tax=Serinibacter salmoneus TaxID=556530 RepID=A0A2A9CWJ2_9MICO|nr:SAM-dependent methyltransferase [Serinibacter salmoneus]PFG18798.1 hypothetical protein ATL40_0342 [Serinibacter salmoneus]